MEDVAMLSLAESEKREQNPSTPLPERRRGLRIRRSHPVKIFEPALGRYFGGETQDISSTGLRLEVPTSTPLRAGRVLNVYVGLAPSGESLVNRRQMVPVRVVWTDRHSAADRGRVFAGVEFMSSISAQVDAA